jgi:hypothetical protein
MALTITVYVAYDTSTGVITLTGGNGPKDDGTVDVDFGPGNAITFEPTGSNTGSWTLTGISWTPTEPAALSWTWVDDKPNTSILLSDDNEIPAGRPAVTYAYTLTVRNTATREISRADPGIINKPAPNMTRRMGGNA